MKLIIPGELTDLNTYIRAERGSLYTAAKIKEDDMETVGNTILKCKLKKINGPVYMTYSWYCENKRKDKDNVSSYGRKVIQDTLVLMRIIPGDGWNDIVGFKDQFFIDQKNPRIEVDIVEQKEGYGD